MWFKLRQLKLIKVNWESIKDDPIIQKLKWQFEVIEVDAWMLTIENTIG